VTEAFIELLSSPLTLSDINQQAELVRQLIDARMTQNPAAEAMLEEASELLAIPLARMEAICNLEDPQDWRRALKVKRLEPAPRLPEEAVYPTSGWIGRYLAWAEHMEVPLAWHFWSALSLIAACSRRNYYFDTGTYRIWPAFYACLVGPSGGGKSLCLQSCTEPLLKRVNYFLERELNDTFDDTINIIPDRLSTAAFLERCQQSYVVDVTAEPIEPTATEDGVDEPTKKRARVTYKKRKDSTSIIIKDELMAFIGKDMYDCTSWCGLLLDLSNGKDTFINPTIGRGLRVLTGVAVTALFASAPENLRKLMPPAFYTGGLQGRFVWCYRTESARVYPTMPPLDPVERDHLANWLKVLSRLPEMEVTRHPETDPWWEQYYAYWDEQKEIEPEFRSWHNRVKDQMLRVAMLLAVSNGRFQIRLDDLETANRVLSKEREKFTMLFQQIHESKEGEATHAVLAAIPSAPKWVSEAFLCSKLLHTVGSVGQLQRILQLLAKAGAVQRGEKHYGATGSIRKEFWQRRIEGS